MTIDPVASRSQRAHEAETLVMDRFVGRFLYLPGTVMGQTLAPLPSVRTVVVTPRTPFHYWWQAHLMDGIVDGGQRRMRSGDQAGAGRSARLARRLLLTITLRNRGTLRNDFFDDMGWLALATQRLDLLHARLRRSGRPIPLRLAQRTLTRELRSGLDGEGGMFWNRDRDFLNTAAAGPAALYLARSGHVGEARSIVEWLHDRLLDDRGLLIDGVRVDGTLVTPVYTYNQGPTLGALLELGEPRDLARAAAIVRAADEYLTEPGVKERVLVTHGTGDGGLFTGILVRNLAAAARHPGLDDEVRGIAERLVLATGDGLWRGRDAVTGLFPTSAAGQASEGSVTRPTVELSTQLQAWMVLEAAARLSGHTA
ncbi:MAG: glycoside hydrolase family 76 protein [Arachnia sp.]